MESSTQQERRGAPAKEVASNGLGDAEKRGSGISLERRFTEGSSGSRIDPIETTEWEKRSAAISGEGGDVVFEQNDVEVPKAWSQLATNVVASKYFRGPLGTPERETSVKQLIGRVVGSVRRWGLEQGYFKSEEQAGVFADELAHLSLIHI